MPYSYRLLTLCTLAHRKPRRRLVVIAAGFIASEHQPDAGGYYRMFPGEPVRPSGLLQVSAIVPIKSINVFKLLTAIAKKGSKNVLVVSHGFGGGLTIPLTAKAKKPLGLDEVSRLNEYLK